MAHIKNRTYTNALKQRAVNVYATVKQHLKISAWYAHILLYLVARVYACTGASAKAYPGSNSFMEK